MTGPGCAVMRNLINTHTHTQAQKAQETAQELWTQYRKWRRLGWKEKKKRRQERVGPVAADPDNLENSIEWQESREGSIRCSGLK